MLISLWAVICEIKLDVVERQQRDDGETRKILYRVYCSGGKNHMIDILFKRRLSGEKLLLLCGLRPTVSSLHSCLCVCFNLSLGRDYFCM